MKKFLSLSLLALPLLALAETEVYTSVDKFVAASTETTISDNPMDYLPDVEFSLSGLDKQPARSLSISAYVRSKNELQIYYPLERKIDVVRGQRLAGRQKKFKLRLWELYVVGAKNNIKLEDMRVVITIASTSASGNYSASEVYLLPDILSIPLDGKSECLSAQGRISCSANVVTHNENLFSKMKGWESLLPPSETLKSDFLNNYAVVRSEGKRKVANISDALEVIYAYSMSKEGKTPWPRNVQLTEKNSPVLIAGIVQSNANKEKFWPEISGLLAKSYNVLQDVLSDFDGQKAVQKILAQEVPQQGNSFTVRNQISTTTTVINNNNVVVPAASRASGAPSAAVLSNPEQEGFYARKRYEQAADDVGAVVGNVFEWFKTQGH